MDDLIKAMNADEWVKEFMPEELPHNWTTDNMLHCPKCSTDDNIARLKVSQAKKFQKVGVKRPVACWDASCGFVGYYEVKG